MTQPSPPVPTLADGFRAGLPFALIVFVFGISFGVLAREAGMGSIAPLAMSMTTFTGASQFAIATILKDGGSTASAAVAGILLASRYLPIGVAVTPALPGRWPARLLQSQLVIDEGFALAVRDGGRFDRNTLIGAGAAIYSGWVVGTAIGLLSGDIVNPEELGLDAAFPALFLALLWPHLRERGPSLVAAGSACLALALIPFVEPGVPIIAGASLCLLGLRR